MVRTLLLRVTIIMTRLRRAILRERSQYALSISNTNN
jgi:hypothetical protein